MEIVDKFDNKRRPLGIQRDRNEKILGEYRQAMHCWIMNDKGEFLIQKRSETKKTNPGKWGVTGGGTDTGETTIDTLKRECKEELGIDIDIENAELMLTSRGKYTYIDVYLLKANLDLKDIVMQEEEVQEIKWATADEIRKIIESEQLVSNIVIYFEMLMKMLDK